MRKLILSLFLLSLTISGLYFTQGSSASVITTFQSAVDPISAQTNYTWRAPLAPDCSSLSEYVPYVAYTFDITQGGSYTFKMNTSSFNGSIYIYQSSFNPNQPCANHATPQNNSGDLLTTSPLTMNLTLGPGLNRWVVVFSARNPTDSGTFSASVEGPAAVTVQPSTFSIINAPSSKSVTTGCQQTLAVYAGGPLPQTFQWYEGISGDFSTSILIPGATSHIYTTPVLTSDKSYWLRITHGDQHIDTETIRFKVYPTNKTVFSGSLDPNQTWNLTTDLCHPTGTFVHYQTTHLKIPVNGTYTIHINKDDNFVGPYAINVYSGSFDGTQPCFSFAATGTINSDLTTFLSGDQTYIIVVSATTPNVTTGDYDGTISTTNDCTLPETIEDALIISGNPLDKAIQPGNAAILSLAYTGGSGRTKKIQWYKGFSGDTSQPIASATSTSYITPTLNQSPPNQPTYYYYWARVNDPGSSTHADTRTAVINVLNPPITYTDVLSTCDETYPQVNGPTTYYKIFPFTVSTDGSYTFNVAANGFTPAVRLYQGYFSPTFPNINYYGPGSTQTLLAGPNTYYLVITSTAADQTGSFTLTINGPALVVPTPRPIITTQPTDKIIFRNQTATLSVTSSTPDVSYQWFTGTCTEKTAVHNGSLSSYTTPAMTDYQNYWVKVSYGVMYVNSPVVHVQIRPQAITDSNIIDEDTTLNIAAPGILANDKKADSKTLKAFKVTDPMLGTRTLGDNGDLTYTPNPNVNGPDAFQYKVSDGTLESPDEYVTILIREVNDAPVRTGGSVNDHTFNEDAATGILHLGGVTYGPGGGTDEAPQQLTYTVTAVPPSSVGNVLLTDGTTVVTTNTTYTIAQIQGMKFKPAPNGNGGPYPFTFTVTDDGTTRGSLDPRTLTQTLNITVKAIADTPSATNATTDEDTQTTSGLVLDRNPGDGDEVGFFQIRAVRGGTLYKNDGVTQINGGQFITYAEGHAGLKFKPDANKFSPNTIFNFDFQASLDNTLSGVGGNTVTATITVNPVAEKPAVTGATTFVNLQTSSGLGITRNPVDGAEIGYYKISSITNGTLYKADGATQIGDGQFITIAEGTAGLRFTPAQDSTAPGSFNVQGSADTMGNGLGPAATANIIVNKYNTSTTITSDNPAPSYTAQQVTVSYSVQNTSGGPAPTGNVLVTVNGGAETCTGTIEAGHCTLTLTTAGNPRTITATYSGNSQFETSSGTKDHVVNSCTQDSLVTTKGDDGTPGTLRSIVANICPDSTITFDPTVFDPATGPHVITINEFGNISGNLLIDKNLTIRGPGANVLTVQRSTASRAIRSRVFNIAVGATVTISGLTISNGVTNSSADADGGGILNAGTLTLNSVAVAGNQAGRASLPTGSGGGIYNKGILNLINSTVSNNNAFIGKGGGIFIEDGSTASIINSTISGNTATTNGGGLAVYGSASIGNSTITNNTGTVSGGGIYNELGTTSIGNSIVAGNTSATGPDVLLLSGLVITNGHNIIGRNDGAESVFLPGGPNASGDLVGTSSSPVPALLGSLADNGGATQTHLPLPGSPALDAGSNANLPPDAFDLDGNHDTTEPLPLDQRRQSRITNATVDIGAVEAGYSIAATSGSGQSAVINSSLATTLQATVTEAGRPKSGASVTFTTQGAGAGGTFNGNLTATVTTDGSGVATAPAFTTNGTAGSYNVVASLDASTLSATYSLTNTQARAQVSLDNLAQSYDGTPKSVAVTTQPAGLAVTLTYDGSLTPPVNAGSYQVSALISDANHTGQTSATLVIAKADQAIDFPALPNKTVGDAPITLTATASSGLPVAFTLVSGPATLHANTLSLNGVGTVLVRATQTGDTNYNAATTLERSFAVNQATQTITFAALAEKTFGEADFTLSATASSGLNVSFAASGQCSVTGASVHLSGAGSCTITASQAGNQDYAAAAPVSQSLTIKKATASLTLSNLSQSYDGAPKSVTATTSPTGISVSLNYSRNNLAVVSPIIAGSYEVSATINDVNYEGSASATLVIDKATPVVTWDNPADISYGTALSSTELNAKASAAGTFTYTPAAGTRLHAGASQRLSVSFTPTDTVNYHAAAKEVSINVSKASQTITFDLLSDKTFGDAPFDLSATSTSGLPITFAIVNGPATINGHTVTIAATGTVTVRATQAGDSDYDAASAVDRTFAVTNTNGNISLSNLTQTYDGMPKSATVTTNPAGLSVTVTYTQNGQTIATPTNAGSYNVMAVINDPNYQGSMSGLFTINKATPAITWNTPASITYGTALSAAQLNATSNVPGAFMYTPAAGAMLGVGSHQLSVTFTPTDAVNYATAQESVQMTVEQTTASEINLGQAAYSAGEDDGHAAVTVTRTGDITGAAKVDYATSDTAGLQPCSVINGVASSRCDYATTLGTLRFAAGEASKTIYIPIVNDSYADGVETFNITLSNATGENLGAVSTAVITITDNEATATGNPVVDTAFFIRQQYIDFLGREPDPVGYQGWQDILNNCPAGDTSCDRIAVSSGFFRSPEFQARGYFIYRFYSASLGRTPLYSEFIPDMAKVSGSLTDAQLLVAKAAFVTEFMSRTEFRNRYDSLTTPTAYVDGLLQTAGLTSHPLRDVWVNGLTNTSLTRADVLRALVESTETYQAFYNQAFVVMQYFGYLRRDPDALYTQWIEKLNSTGDYRTMINGFINSNEYVQRFGP